MSKLEKLKDRAKALEAKDPRAAVQAWLEILRAQELEGEANPDLAIYNRIGDLYLKLKDPAQAADHYDRAVDKYAELGFYNNAIAMCNKVLRNAPARQTTYLKLAKLYAAKGFMAEAKQNFVEYAERMQRAGKIDQAFSALKEFTDLSPESEHLREMLEEHLRMYGEPGRRSSAAARPPAAPAAPASPEDITKSGRHKTSTLVFLDVDEPPRKPAGKAGPGARVRPPSPAAPAPPRRPEARRLIAEPEPEPDTSLEIESTSLAEDDEAEAPAGGLLEGLESTSADFGSVQASAPRTPPVRDDFAEPHEVDPLDGLELTAPAEPAEEEEVEPEEPAPPPPPPRAPAPPSRAAPRMPPLKRPAPREPEPPRVKPVTPRRPPAPASPPPAAKSPPAPARRKTVVEIPPLELEPDFETAVSESRHDVDDQPLALDEAEGVGKFISTDDDTSISTGRRSGYMDLGVEGIVNQGDIASSLVFDGIEQAPATPGIEHLEARVADNPDDADAHLALGEALIEAGERARGIEELDIATGAFESVGNLPKARSLTEEILRLDPNSIRHRQKGVEFAFKSGDKAQLIEAYLELADTLLRSDLPDKARAVYERVAEHDARNQRARSALAMLAPAPAEAAKPEGKVKAKDAKMKVRHEADVGGDFVDLGSMILDEAESVRDTRMKVQEEEPSGDEEQDFQEMLARFKQGIEENIDEADFQSHYDLGVAFKEMGLLDEAIGEFQKALRAPEGKLRTSEALGVCFVEKGAYSVAESILRRGLDLPASGDQERLGVLYWLARALEEQGNGAEARELYGRVFAVDIRFRDVGDRVKALAKARR